MRHPAVYTQRKDWTINKDNQPLMTMSSSINWGYT